MARKRRNLAAKKNEKNPKDSAIQSTNVEKDPTQYQVIHRGRVTNGSLRNPHRMRLANGKLTIAGTGGVDGEVVVDYLAEVQRRQGMRICRRVREQQDALQLLAIIFGIYIILLLPHCILYTVVGICRSCQDRVSDAIVTTLHWMALATCVVNPPIYCIFSKLFRRSLIRMCSCSR